MEDFGFEDLRFQIDPQSGANSATGAVHAEAVVVDAAEVDACRAAGIVAGGPQPLSHAFKVF